MMPGYDVCTVCNVRHGWAGLDWIGLNWTGLDWLGWMELDGIRKSWIVPYLENTPFVLYSL